MNTKTAVYLRVSTDKQEHASQRRAVDDFLTGRGLTATYYTDKSSGGNLKRTGLDKLERDIFNGSLNHVVFYSLDRFSRELVAGLVKIDQWQKQGVRLTFVADQLDLDGGFLGDVVIKILVSIKLAFAEHERKRIGERVTLGLAHARQHGTKSGRPIGRPHSVTHEQVTQALSKCKGNKQKAAKLLGVSLGTVYNVLRKSQENNAA